MLLSAVVLAGFLALKAFGSEKRPTYLGQCEAAAASGSKVSETCGSVHSTPLYVSFGVGYPLRWTPPDERGSTPTGKAAGPQTVGRPMESTQSARVALLLLLASAVALSAQEPADSTSADGTTAGDVTTVREAIEVVEARITAAFPRLGPKRVAEIDPADLVVLEGVNERAVTRIERIDLRAGAPWTVLAYFDLALSDAETPAVAAFTLGALSSRLADLGTLVPLVARDVAVERLPVARDAGEIERTMSSIAAERGTDAFDRQRLSARPRDVQAGRALLEESRLLRRRADLLVSEAAAACSIPPCLLLLVSDGFDVRTELFHPGHAAAVTGAELPTAIADEVGKVLAALGFVVVGLPLRSPEVLDAEALARHREQRGAGTDFDDWRDHVAGARDGTTASTNRPEPDPKSRNVGAPNPYDTWVLPELEPLRLWAVASSGRVLRVPEQVEPALEELGERWFVYFRSERSEGGEMRPVELRFSPRGDFQKKRRAKEVLGLVPDEEPLRYPRWVRSATPPEVAAARLRRVASGDALDGAAIATREPGDGDSTWIVVATTDGKTRLRLSRIDEQGAVVHRIAERRSCRWPRHGAPRARRNERRAGGRGSR